MKIVPIYKNKIISLPAEAVGEKLSTATNEELKVLIRVFTESEFSVSDAAAELEMTEKTFMRALESWQNAGVLVYDSAENKKISKKSASVSSVKSDKKSEDAEEKRKKKIEMHTSLPSYSSDELAEVMNRVKGSGELIDSCQQLLGKIFNTAEASKIIGLSDQLSLSNEYILLLCAHAVSVDKRSVRYIEKLAVEFYDKDIVSYEELEEELNTMKSRMSTETFVRTLFGIGKRAFIKKEKEAISDWTEKYGFGRDMIEKAYEITVSHTGEPKISYANAILERWYADGIKTPEDVDAADSKRNTKNGTQSSFETDDFFEAALNRTYSDDGGKK